MPGSENALALSPVATVYESGVSVQQLSSDDGEAYKNTKKARLGFLNLPGGKQPTQR